MLETAFAWLCDRREEYADSSDVWNVRRRWTVLMPWLQAELLAGRYRLSPVRRFHSNGETIELWASLDALVLKALAIVLRNRVDFAPTCFHLPGEDGEKRGSKAAVRALCDNLADNPFVFRTDVKSYYASIDHGLLLAQLRDKLDDPIVLDLVGQYLHRTIDENCLYSTVERCISLGCPLSPVMGALYLDVLDRRMADTGLFYVRFMDDWVILAPTRWALRRAVSLVNRTLEELRVEQHPDKTFIGKVERGFDFLGYRISTEGIVGVAAPSVVAFQERVLRLYEQNALPEVIRQRVEDYVRRWKRWVVSGIGARSEPRLIAPGGSAAICLPPLAPLIHSA